MEDLRKVKKERREIFAKTGQFATTSLTSKTEKAESGSIETIKTNSGLG